MSAARADRAAPPLLRRHVLGGADHRGAAGRAALVERLGEAEVGEEGALAFDQDVVRLDVAVDDAGGVGGVERFGDLAEQRRSPAPAAAAPRGRSACAGRRPRPGASRRSARRRPRASRRSGPPPGGRAGRRAATRAGSARGSRRGRPARGRSPSAPPAVRGRGGWRGRRRPSRRGRSARRSGIRRRVDRWRGLPPAVIRPGSDPGRSACCRRSPSASANRLPVDDRRRSCVPSPSVRSKPSASSALAAVGDVDRDQLLLAFGWSMKAATLAAVGGEDRVGLRAVRQLGELAAPCPGRSASPRGPGRGGRAACGRRARRLRRRPSRRLRPAASPWRRCAFIV